VSTSSSPLRVRHRRPAARPGDPPDAGARRQAARRRRRRGARQSGGAGDAVHRTGTPPGRSVVGPHGVFPEGGWTRATPTRAQRPSARPSRRSGCRSTAPSASAGSMISTPAFGWSRRSSRGVPGSPPGEDAVEVRRLLDRSGRRGIPDGDGRTAAAGGVVVDAGRDADRWPRRSRRIRASTRCARRSRRGCTAGDREDRESHQPTCQRTVPGHSSCR
jgi:hypothetical protein